MAALASRAGTFSPQATAVAIVTLAIIVAIARWLPRVPGSIVALCAGTVGGARARPGRRNRRIAVRRHPERPAARRACRRFASSLIPTLLSPAITVGLLGAIESLMSAMVADKMSGDRHDSNMELVAQGVANLVSPLVGGPSRDRRDRPDGHQHPIGRAGRPSRASCTRSRCS